MKLEDSTMIIKIEKMGINGEGIGYINNIPTFVPHALVGEEVEIELINNQPRYKIAKCIRIIKKSIHRIDSECKVSRQCGACTLMSLDYQEQLNQKKAMVDQALYKYAKIKSKEINDIVANPTPLAYRNALKLPLKEINGKLESGLYAPQSNMLIVSEHCAIHETKLEQIRKEIMNVLNEHQFKSYDKKTKVGLRTLVLRGFLGKYQCTLVSGKDILSQALIDDLMNIEGLHSLYQNINIERNSIEVFGKKMLHLAGSKTLELKLEEYVFRLSPQAFFQLNTAQATNIYKKVKELVSGANFMVEAYCGIGGVAIFCHDVVRKIIGVEVVKEAVKNANENAKLNRADNCKFVCNDAPQELRNIAKDQKIDVIVVDPPRSGLSKAMIESLIKSKPRRIVYISCNPSTLGKNIEELNKYYAVKEVTPYDMFSYTPHVETVVLLQRK